MHTSKKVCIWKTEFFHAVIVKIKGHKFWMLFLRQPKSKREGLERIVNVKFRAISKGYGCISWIFTKVCAIIYFSIMKIYIEVLLFFNN